MPRGRIALITGAGSAQGIGFSTARALARAGARVMLTATGPHVEERLEELNRLAPGGHGAEAADLTDPDQVARLFAVTREVMGPPAILVNAAGMVRKGEVTRAAPVEALEPGDWTRDLAMNATTAFLTIRAALPAMQAAGYGRIVNVASVTGPTVAIAGAAGYGAAKAALCGLTRTVALENAARGITCNAVLPGWIATGSATEEEAEAARRSPAGRGGTPGEVAACCLFLASRAASFVNGAMLVVDGANTLVEGK